MLFVHTRHLIDEFNLLNLGLPLKVLLSK
uniref:Uncharacterized protein n=1 Tax=Anguilla anguilla TaxID=7936 RepID=A0A0E9T891_ANGAN